MAKFTSVLDEREDRIVFEKEDGSEFTSPRSPEANKLAAALPRKAAPAPAPAPAEPPPAEPVAEAPVPAPLPDAEAPQPTLYAEPSMPEPERVTQAMGLASTGTAVRQPIASDASPTRIALPPENAEAESRQMTPAEIRLADAQSKVGQPKWSPGRPAVTVADLERNAANKRMDPQTMREQRTYEQAPLMPGVLDERIDILQKQREVSDTQAVIDEERAQRDIEAQAQASKAAQEETIMNRALTARAAQRVQQRMAQVEELDSKIANWSEDPNRVFKGNALSQIGAIIAQAIGAYSAALGGGPNQAMQLINGVIDRDIAAQRAEYGKLKDARVNAYGWYVEQLGDEALATAALKASQLKIVQAYDASVAAADKRTDVQQAWEVRDLAWREAIANTLQGAADLEHGKVVQDAAGKARGPQAATRGGWVQPSLKDMIKEQKEINDLAEQLGLSQGGLTREAREKIAVHQATLDEKASNAGFREALAKYRDDRGQVTKAQSAVREMRAILEQYKNKDIPGHGISLQMARAFHKFGSAITPGEYEPENVRNVLTAEGRAVLNASERLLSNFIYSVSGAAATDEERKFLRGALYGKTDDEMRAGVEYMENMMANQLSDLDATYAETGAPDAYLRNIKRAREIHNPNGDPQKGIGFQAMNMIVEGMGKSGGGAPTAIPSTRKYGIQK
jgi:hypothetical protein